MQTTDLLVFFFNFPTYFHKKIILNVYNLVNFDKLIQFVCHSGLWQPFKITLFYNKKHIILTYERLRKKKITEEIFFLQQVIQSVQ